MLKKVSKEIEELYYQLCVCLGEEYVKSAEQRIEKRPKMKDVLLRNLVYDNNFSSLEELKEYIIRMKNELGIKDKEELGCQSKEELESKLSMLFSKLSSIRDENLTKIQSIAPEFEKIFVKNIPQNATTEEKINYLVHYIANIITYADDWFNYAFRTKVGYMGTIRLKDGVPDKQDEDECLVLGQGVCIDIAYIAQRLGKKIGLDIQTEGVTYKTFAHELNNVRLDNGKYANIDITRLIRGDKKPHECILVSNEHLLQQQEYEELRNGNKQNQETVTTMNDSVDDFYERHKEIIDKMVMETLELRNRVIWDSTFDFPIPKEKQTNKDKIR